MENLFTKPIQTRIAVIGLQQADWNLLKRVKSRKIQVNKVKGKNICKQFIKVEV